MTEKDTKPHLPRVLLIDDEESNLDVLQLLLLDVYSLVMCRSGAEALAVLSRDQDFALIITDHRMPNMTGVEFLRAVNDKFPTLAATRIVLSAYSDPAELLAFINHGRVFHWIEKPLEQQATLNVIRRAIDAYNAQQDNRRLAAQLAAANQRLERENLFLKQKAGTSAGFENIIGNSEKLQGTLNQLARVRVSDAPVHVQGETGTGKELIARALHDGGPRHDKPFVACNCAGFTETLAQSTLFGHIKGAFTGADRNRPGVFQEANGGTLFLDEVAELSLPVQASLLRALQEHEIVPTGATQPLKVDLRVISATNKDLREEVKAGRFREDLYFRLVVVAVEVPPLRERRSDILTLAEHFLALYSVKAGKRILGFAPTTASAFEKYTWPGNVRELENEVQRLVILGDADQPIEATLLSAHIRAEVAHFEPRADAPGVIVPYELSYDDALDILQRRLVERALSLSDGVIAKAADLLRMNHSRLTKLKGRLGL